MTRYCVTLKYRNTGNEKTYRFDSMTERMLQVMAMSAWADVLKEWEE